MLALPFLLLSCGGKKEGEFTEKEIEWLVYETGDTLRYTATNGEEEVLYAQSRTDLTQLRDYYPIEAEISLVNLKNNRDFKIYLLKDSNGNFKRYLKAGEVYRPLDLMSPQASMEIGGKKYKDVYVVEEDTAAYPEINIWKVYFNKSEGIIKYITRDKGEYIITDQ